MNDLTTDSEISATDPQSRGLLDWLVPALLPAAAVALMGAIGAGWAVMLGAMGVHGLITALVAHQQHRHRAVFGVASQVTLARSGLVVVLAAALLEPALYREQGWLMAGLALLALALDGVDGWLARRHGEISAFGARFDMETDAALILVLCLAVLAAGQAGSWVLAIGVMRYAFVAAAQIWPWLEAPLPTSFRRKLACVWQVGALLICLLPPIGPAAATLILGSALAFLAASFAIDVAWLARHRNDTSELTEDL